MSEAWVGLAEAIIQLRTELDTARAAGEGEQLRFEVGPVELEFTVDVKKEGGLNTGIRWGLVSAEAKGTLASSSSHRMKLVLQPKDAVTGRDAEVASRWSPQPADD
jgi:hypothetical protein